MTASRNSMLMSLLLWSHSYLDRLSRNFERHLLILIVMFSCVVNLHVHYRLIVLFSQNSNMKCKKQGPILSLTSRSCFRGIINLHVHYRIIILFSQHLNTVHCIKCKETRKYFHCNATSASLIVIVIYIKFMISLS